MDVIIPTTGKRPIELKECIITLAKQTQPVNITIVLGATHPKTKKKIEEICNEYNCTLLDEPYKKIKGSHRAVACNFGLQNTKDDFVAFVDDDVSLPYTWAETSLKYFTDSHVAGVTSGCIPYSFAFHRVQSFGSDAHSQQFAITIPVESIPGYNSVYRRKAINRVGGFSEDIGGCEDWELNYRLCNAGWQLLGIPETPVEHRHSYTFQSFAKQMFGYGWSRSRLFRVKHIFTLKHAIPTIGLIALLLLCLNYMLLLFVLGAYIAGLSFLAFHIKSSNIADFFKTLIVLVIMYVSWALGYLRGLIL
jgi:cellulose synthase/poly-beta-1,6-N-acetylglucosamine synthase-like glycosyltransferase